MSADLPFSSSRSHPNVAVNVAGLPKNSPQPSYIQAVFSQNFLPSVEQTLLSKILPMFFFLGGVVIMAKIIHS